MGKAVIALIWFTFFSIQTASASDRETFRIDRPVDRGVAPASATSMIGMAGSAVSDPQRTVGQLIFAGMRTPMPKTAFERWRQNYCAPFICNMVFCHGTCADYEEHCPSFAESNRVMHLAVNTCLSHSQLKEEVDTKGAICCPQNRAVQVELH